MSQTHPDPTAFGAAHRALALVGIVLLTMAAVGPLGHDHHPGIETSTGSWECSADHDDSGHGVAEAPVPAGIPSTAGWHETGPSHQHVCIGCQSKTRRGQQALAARESLALDAASRLLLAPSTQSRRVFRHATPPLRGPPRS